MSDQMTAPALHERIRSVDLLRGLVMIIMALDHVRDFFGPTPGFPEDLEEPGLALFMTRWITHFCAPVFLFLSGTSAWLYRQNTACSTFHLQKFLWTRGLWLIFVEFAIVNTSWLSFMGNFVFVQVIWAIGWSMIVLGLLLPLGARAIAAIGLVMIFGHNLLDGIAPETFGSFAVLWNFLHVQGGFGFAENWYFWIGYPLVPWLGVMMAGYAFGEWLTSLPGGGWYRRCFIAGLAASLVYLVLRGFSLYGDPSSWDVGGDFTSSFISFLNVEKYPPSLQFLLMTLGPALMLMPLMEGWRGRLVDAISVYGRVPFFYYVLHIPLIHLLAVAYSETVYGRSFWWFGPPQGYPETYSQNLWLVWFVWAVVVLLLFPACRWYAALKRRRKDWWLSYL